MNRLFLLLAACSMSACFVSDELCYGTTATCHGNLISVLCSLLGTSGVLQAANLGH
jgi:hypothetical protein